MNSYLRSIHMHILYVAIIAILFVVIGIRYIPSLWEITAEIPGKDNKNSYTLRLLGSGNLVFEKHKFLPLASYHDYWGDMSVSNVKWIDDRIALISMSDGTQLKITLGNIEVMSSTKSR